MPWVADPLVDIVGPLAYLLLEAQLLQIGFDCLRLEVVLQILSYLLKVVVDHQDCKLAPLGSFEQYPHQMGLGDPFYQDSCLKPFSCHMMVRTECFSLLQAISSYR